ncbi:MAG: hypothetical protein HRT45_19765 [Bdellovibrionales bacterium]|nr:hypothetical protein [Bdellovibrionales bacterium]
MATHKTLFIALNEFNLQLLEQSASGLKLKHIQRLLSLPTRSTDGGLGPDSDQLQPWVQWVSLLTGSRAEQHQVKHLGQRSSRQNQFVWDELADLGKSSLVVSALNGFTKKEAKVALVQDPWSPEFNEPPERYQSALNFARVMCRSRGDESFKKKAVLALRLFTHSWLDLGVSRLTKLTWQFARQYSLDPARPYVGYTFYEFLLAHTVLNDLKKNHYDFGFVFLNCIAHIQHYYWSESESDLLSAPYDYALSYLNDWLAVLFEYCEESGTTLIVSNGLTQRPSANEQWYSYRLKNANEFFKSLVSSPFKIEPLMSYDLHIEFTNLEDAKDFELKLNDVIIANGPVFFCEREAQSTRVFVRTDYTRPSDDDTEMKMAGKYVPFLQHFESLAHRKGKHDSHFDVLTNSEQPMNFEAIDQVKTWLIRAITRNSSV